MFRSRFLACAVSLVVLSGCSVGRTVTKAVGFSGGGDEGQTGGTGLVVGDEPFAVKAGSAILSQGGSAADAATAIYFALSATYPVAAGLGGGGICIVHDPVSGADDEFDFPAIPAKAGGAFAVPGNVKGFQALQDAYGALPWQRDVSPGEWLATGGFPISQALAARLVSSQDVIRLDAELAMEFLDESGHPRVAQTVVSNRELAQTLSQIREHGANGFYQGAVAQRLIAYSAAQGGGLTADDLSSYSLQRGPARHIQMGNLTIALPRAQTPAGAFAGVLFKKLSEAGAASSGDVAGAAKQTLAELGVQNMPKDLGATGFAVRDAKGQAVACAVSMNAPFGTGRNADATGVVMASPPVTGTASLAAVFLTPIIATESGSVSLVGAGAGGPNGTAAMAEAASRVARGKSAAASSANSISEISNDTANAIVCQGGICAVLPDPRGHGLGEAAGR